MNIDFTRQFRSWSRLKLSGFCITRAEQNF